jgi:2,5-dichlorohydroquinone reductive dechlorinase
MSDSELQTLIDALNAHYTDPERNRVINGAPSEVPRFELYHFYNSLCSQKLRTVLDEKDVAYMSHDIDILPPTMEQYYPEYVRLRIRGGQELGLMNNLVTGYTGRSATETEGFDPCVVPTMVDHEASKVLVNSKYMMQYLDDTVDSGTDLIPDDIRDEVMRQVDIVDRTAHPAIFYGGDPDGDRRPVELQQGMIGAHDGKIAKIRENMAKVPDDPILIEAYQQKIVKEAGGKKFIHTKSDMQGVLREIKDMIAALEQDLSSGGGEWLIGDRFTLADAVWAVSLFRLQWDGLGYIWKTDDTVHYPQVAEYTRKLYRRPSFARAVIEWPLNPPSPHLADYFS